MKQPTLTHYVCPTSDCKKQYMALPGSRVTCSHADTPARLRPVAVAKPSNQPTLTEATQ